MSMNLSQIIAAMMQATPSVTAMGAAPGGGGGMPAIRAMKGGMSGTSGRGRQPQGAPAPQRDPMAGLSQMPQGFDPNGGERGGDPNGMMQGGEGVMTPYAPGMQPADPYTQQDPQQIMLQLQQAQSEVDQLRDTRDKSPKQRWQDRENLPAAEEKAVWAQQVYNDYLKSYNTAIANQAGDQVYDLSIASNVPEEQAREFASYAKLHPDETKELLKLAGTTGENIRGEQAGYAREDFKEGWDSGEMKRVLEQAYPNVDPRLLASMSRTDSSFTENAAWLDGQRETREEKTEEEIKSDLRRFDIFESSSRIVGQIGDIREHLANEGFIGSTGGVAGLIRSATGLIGGGLEGQPGKFDAWTDAGVLDEMVQPIISKIGLDTIRKMREASKTGGALGNVSNFEVQMVQKAIASLNTGLPKEEFLKNLSIVETAFQRGAYLARNGESMRDAAAASGEDAYTYITKQLDEQFPINPEFEKDMEFLPPEGMTSRSPWTSDGTLPQTVDPNVDINIPTDAIKTWNPKTGKLE